MGKGKKRKDFPPLHRGGGGQWAKRLNIFSPPIADFEFAAFEWKHSRPENFFSTFLLNRIFPGKFAPFLAENTHAVKRKNYYFSLSKSILCNRRRLALSILIHSSWTWSDRRQLDHRHRHSPTRFCSFRRCCAKFSEVNLPPHCSWSTFFLLLGKGSYLDDKRDSVEWSRKGRGSMPQLNF